MLRLILLGVLASVVYRTVQRVRAAMRSEVLGEPRSRARPRVQVDRSRVVDAEFREVPAAGQEEG